MSETYILQPDDAAGRDVSIISTTPATNKSGVTWVAMGEHNALVDYFARMVIRFDTLSTGGVPKNRTVLDAKLGLYLYNDTCNYSRSYSFFRFLKSYVHTEVTWNKRNATTNWEVAGIYDAGANADYEAANPIATTTLAASEAAGFKYWDMDNDKIFQVINGIAPNYGFFGMCDAEYNDLYDFYASRFATAANRPKLTIEVEDFVSEGVLM